MDNVSQILAEVDPAPMKKAVAFCSKIKTSQKIATTFNNFNLPLKADHVDGTMPATTRDEKLSWLKNADTCRILTNVRCLSEGVDVPSLDAVLFLSSRKSKVEIVQAVGRVMRKSPDKKYGYIIIPVVLPVDKNPEEILAESADFGTVWDVLNALRAHDSRMDIFIEEIKLQKKSSHILIGKTREGDENHGESKPYQLSLKFEDLQGYSFVKNNPVSKYLENILSILDSKNIAADSEQLKKFYDSVRERCKIATSAEDRQKIIIELYEKFFKTAAPLTVERLGIVYTPVEVVDFILRAVNEVLKENFGKTLSSKGVHILDPFAGTGTFIVRLIQSNLIGNRDILRKYFRELHANEIVLLAYYIAAINIENAFHDRVNAQNYQPFEGICFTDTFQAYEQDDNAKVQTDFKDFRDPMKENSERVKNQTKTRIEVIVGNPPYSVGQRSANDNAQNIFYPKLERRISETYAAKTAATNKNSLYSW